MVGHLSQLVALVSYGNAYLRGRDIGSFYPSNSEFCHCNTVEFSFPKPAFAWLSKRQVAESPLKWLETLKENKCVRFKLSHLDTPSPEVPDHILSAFVGGGGRSFVETVFETTSDYWEAKWQVTNQNAPDRKIWRVSYSVVAKNAKQSINLQIDLSSINRRLEQILSEISDFARKQKLDHFAACFQNGIDCLKSDKVMEKNYHKDLVPLGWYSLEAEQLLTAASNAWVFGGMGSWNDLVFEGEENKIYSDLSAKLYSIINESIGAAVNSKT